jgi:hypothetical protein
MKKIASLFLQIVIVLIGLCALAFMLWEPHLEGRNAHATPFEVYFKDPFLAFAYVASIPFFIGLYQAFKVLGYAGQNRLSSQATAKALRIIRYCALSMIGFVVVSVVFMPFSDPDDGPPGVVMRVLLICVSIIVATTAAKLERFTRNAATRETE